MENGYLRPWTPAPQGSQVFAGISVYNMQHFFSGTLFYLGGKRGGTIALDSFFLFHLTACQVTMISQMESLSKI